MAIQRSELSKSLEALTKKIEKENKSSVLSKSNNELKLQIETLEENSNENSKELQRLFEMAVEKIDNPESSRQAITAAEKQLETIKKTADTEEQRRERDKAQEEANDRLAQIAQGIDGMASSFESFADNLKPSGGMLAGLAGLALLFGDPEKIKEILLSAATFVNDLIGSVRLLLEGDFSGALEKMKGHLLGISVTLGAIALFFGGTIIRAVSSIFKAAKAIKDTFLKIGGNFKNIGKVFGQIFKRILLPVAIIMSVWEAIKGAMAGYEEGGIVEAIKGAITGLFDGLIGGLLDMLKNGLSWIVEKLGFENAAEALDSFSFSELFKSFVDSVFSLGENAFNWLKEKFTGAWEFISGMLSPGEDGDGSFSISDMIMGAIDKIKDLFSSIFDFLPSFDDIKNSIKSILPSWLGGEETTAEPAEVDKNTLAEPERPGMLSRMFGLDKEAIQTTPRVNTSGVRTLSPTEVTPIAAQSGVMEGTNSMLNANSGPAVIAIAGGGGGSSNSSTNVNNMSASSYNFSQGFSADDFVRSDFVNFIR